MKKNFIIVMMLLLFIPLSACAKKIEQVEITFKQNRPEFDGQLKAFAEAYERETGIKVNIVSCGGTSCSLDDMLKSDYAAGKLPEIFAIENVGSYSEWASVSADLSLEKWVDDTDLALKSDDKVVGFPVNVEGWGLAYNADMLEAAEIDPLTLINYDAYVAAFEKLNDMKIELGIDSVISVAAGPNMYWYTKDFIFNSLLSDGLSYGDLSVTSNLLSGKVDSRRLSEFADWIDLIFSYADPIILRNGDYNTQVNAFLNQKSVFLHQGSWADGNLKEADFDMAFAPFGSTKNVAEGIFVSVSAWYVVNKDSEYIEEAKDFLEYMVYSQIGQDFMVNKIGLTPAFKNFAIEPKGQLSKSVAEWLKAGKIYSLNQNNFDEDFRNGKISPILDQLANNILTLEQFKVIMTEAFIENAK